MTSRLRRGLMSLLLLVLYGCGASSTTPAPAATPSTTTAGAPARVQAILAASTIVVGSNRMPIGIVVDGTPINDPDATVHVRFYYLDGEEPGTVAGESDTTYYGRNLPFGIYVTYPNLPKAGAWGLDIAITIPGMAPATSRLRIDVLETDPTPALGTPAISVDTPTAAQPADLARITSDPQPDLSLYRLSIADALKDNKPLAVLFGTPGFCKTATCGPSIQVMRALQKRYGDQMNFIHVETYQYPFAESVQATPPRLSPGMTAWNLQSEPWVFLIDAQGIIRYKYEGGITDDELDEVIKTVLQPAPGVQP